MKVFEVQESTMAAEFESPLENEKSLKVSVSEAKQYFGTSKKDYGKFHGDPA